MAYFYLAEGRGLKIDLWVAISKSLGNTGLNDVFQLYYEEMFLSENEELLLDKNLFNNAESPLT